MTSTLTITGLRVSVAGKEVLKGFDLTMQSGEVHVIMGPNGSGKSTLAHALAGHPGYKVLDGSVTLDGVELLSLSATERARHGLLLALQHPMEVPGVRPADMLVAAGASADGLRERMRDESIAVDLKPELLDRFMNVDLSGGERKRAEMVQIGVLKPRFAMLDEIDSGLDVDALGAVSRRIEEATKEWNLGVLAITHFQRLLDELHADVIHVLVGGKIVKSGGPELAKELEATGYSAFQTA